MNTENVQSIRECAWELNKEIEALDDKLSSFETEYQRRRDLFKLPESMAREPYDTVEITSKIVFYLFSEKRQRKKRIEKQSAIIWKTDYNYGEIGTTRECEPDGWCEPSYEQVSRSVLDEALNYKTINHKIIEINRDITYFEITQIINRVFALRNEILLCSFNTADFEDMESLAEEIVAWAEQKIGFGKRIYEYQITEFAGQILEQISELRYIDDISCFMIMKLARFINHLATRIWAYCGLPLDEIRDKIEAFRPQMPAGFSEEELSTLYKEYEIEDYYCFSEEKFIE